MMKMSRRTRVGSAALAGVMLALGLGLGGGLGGCVIVIGGKGKGDWEHDGSSYTKYHHDDRHRPYIGVTTSGLSESLAAQLDVNRRRSTLLTSVETGRPAERAGLRKWDVVIEIDGDANASPDRFRRAILQTDPGDALVLTVLRQNEVLEIEVEPEPRSRRTRGMYDD